MLRLQDVSQVYHRGAETIRALCPVDLHADAGDLLAIVGPSGSGKTTLLSILGGMLTPTTGTVLLQDQSLYETSVGERARLRNEQIGFVFQNFNLVPWMTARENVELPLTLYRSDARYRRCRATELLERFGLCDRMQHKPSELSAGQQQRVALARTLAMNPQLVLADEPTGNLDPDSRDVVLQTLQELRDDGRTVILVTHDATVSSIADRLLRITDGRVTEAPQAISA